MKNLGRKIVDSIKDTSKEEVYEIFSQDLSNINGGNEFLFFIKPELTTLHINNFSKVIDMILEKFLEQNLAIKNIKLLPASYLKKHSIIAQHYGVINKISSNAKDNLSETAVDSFKAIYSKSVGEVQLLGGGEFLKKHSEFNAISLEHLWKNLPNRKLAGGTYCEQVEINAQTIYLVNGFHPRQLLHYTENDRYIITFTLCGNLDWKNARRQLIGATNPIQASEGSIRRTLLDCKDLFQIPEVSQSLNGVHLSAGPIEALVELVRYNSNFSDTSGSVDITSYEVGNLLSDNFDSEKVSYILSNPNIKVDEKVVSIFDYTEEKNSAELIKLLKRVV